MFETALYGFLVTFWLYWFAADRSRKVDVSLGLVIGSVATLMLLRSGWHLVEALRIAFDTIPK